MRKRLSPRGVNSRMVEFLKTNPNIKKALKAFDISASQYEKALQAGVVFYSSTSTSSEAPLTSSGKAK